MPSRTPSNIVYLSGGTVPQFWEDCDVQDPGAERQYYNQLAVFRRAWHCGRSLSIGDPFDVAFPAVVEPEGGREISSSAPNGGDYKLVITEVLQPFIESEARWSLVCTADVRTRISNEIGGTVALKIFQASLLPLESRSPFSLALSPKQLAGCENYAYTELKDLQVTAILDY